MMEMTLDIIRCWSFTNGQYFIFIIIIIAGAKIGTWTPLDGINITKKAIERTEEMTDSLKTRVLVVTTIEVNIGLYIVPY